MKFSIIMLYSGGHFFVILYLYFIYLLIQEITYVPLLWETCNVHIFGWLFQLKELEKLGPRKGVISQSVKDVIQSLVDDDLVSKDKIGTSVSGHF